MKDRVNLKLQRYMARDVFRWELMQLRAYRSSYVCDWLFDWFEETGLAPPIVRLE